MTDPRTARRLIIDLRSVPPDDDKPIGIGCPKCGAIGLQWASGGPDRYAFGCHACGDATEVLLPLRTPTAGTFTR